METSKTQTTIAPIITNDILYEEISPLGAPVSADDETQPQNADQKTSAMTSLKTFAFSAKQKIEQAVNSESVQNIKNSVGAKFEAAREFFKREKKSEDQETPRTSAGQSLTTQIGKVKLWFFRPNN